MSGDQNPVHKGCDDANISAKSHMETKTSVKKNDAIVADELDEVVEDKKDAWNAVVVDQDQGGPPEEEMDNKMEKTDIALNDPNIGAKAKTKPKIFIKNDSAAFTEGTVELDEVNGDCQSVGVVDQDPFGPLGIMEQLEIAEAGEPYNQQSSEVSPDLLDSKGMTMATVLLISFFSVLLPTGDVFSDVIYTTKLFQNGNYRFGACSLVPLLISWMMTSKHWFEIETKEKRHKLKTLPLLILLVYPQWRALRVIYHGLKKHSQWRIMKEEFEMGISHLGRLLS